MTYKFWICVYKYLRIVHDILEGQKLGNYKKARFHGSCRDLNFCWKQLNLRITNLSSQILADN